MSNATDIPQSLRPGNAYADFVQRALSGIYEQSGNGLWINDLLVASYVFASLPLPPMTVQLSRGQEIIWGIHAGHKAREPQPSPFVDFGGGIVPDTNLLTIVLARLSPKSTRLTLARAFPGEYAPPLPWMKSVQTAPGGLETSDVFWGRNAYLLRSSRLIKPGTETTIPPKWYRDMLRRHGGGVE